AQIAAELTQHFEVHWSTNKEPRFTSLHWFGKNIIWLGHKLGQLDKPGTEKKIKRGEQVYLYDDLKKLLKKTIKKKQVIEAKGPLITFESGEQETYKIVLFATGFKPDFDYLHLDNFENNLDHLRTQQGVSQ